MDKKILQIITLTTFSIIGMAGAEGVNAYTLQDCERISNQCYGPLSGGTGRDKDCTGYKDLETKGDPKAKELNLYQMCMEKGCSWVDYQCNLNSVK